MGWQKSCGHRKEGDTSVEENPNKGNKRFWSYMLEAGKNVLDSPSVCFVLILFPRHLLLGWTLAGCTSVACFMSPEWQVPGARCWGTCCFYSSLHFRSILSLVCSCKHDFRVLASLSLRHWQGTDVCMALKLCFLGFMYGINLVFSYPDPYWVGSLTAWHLEELIWRS